MSAPAFRYVGPVDLRDAVVPGSGHRVGSAAEFADWAAARTGDETTCTYVVGRGGVLRLAPRRSEHVACADGEPVLAAGEVGFAQNAGRWTVVEISNLSTGYCPDVTSWAAVAAALDRVGLARPGGFTHEVVFRRCPDCGERGIVREGDFTCVFCGGDLPLEWNVDPLHRNPSATQT